VVFLIKVLETKHDKVLTQKGSILHPDGSDNSFLVGSLFNASNESFTMDDVRHAAIS